MLRVKIVRANAEGMFLSVKVSLFKIEHSPLAVLPRLGESCYLDKLGKIVNFLFLEFWCLWIIEVPE